MRSTYDRWGIRPRGRSRRRRRGLSLVEVMIAASLGLLISAALVSFGVYISRLSKSIMSQLKFAHYSQRSVERIAQTVRYAKSIRVMNSGTRVECTDDNDIISAIYYSDADGIALTLSNNRLFWVRNINAASPTPVCIACYISPVAGSPIFDYQDRTSALEVNYRIGDPSNIPGAVFQRETGPGPQGVTVSAAFGPRNSYME